MTSNENVPTTQNAPTAPTVPARKTIGQLLLSKKSQIDMALPKHLDADRLMRICLTEMSKNPNLAKTTPDSFIGSVIQAAQLGLEPGSHLGHGYLIPFQNNKTNRYECQFMPGYRGMIDLARRSGKVVSISARAVHEGDQFEYEYGLDEKLKHIPGEDNDRAPLLYVYAIARFKDGGHHFEVMTDAQIEKIKAGSKSKNFGPWVDHYDEMAKKTVIRRLFKFLPISVELQRAVLLDEQIERGESQGNESVLTEASVRDIECDVLDSGSLNSMAEAAPQQEAKPTPAEQPIKPAKKPAKAQEPTPEPKSATAPAAPQQEASRAPQPDYDPNFAEDAPLPGFGTNEPAQPAPVQQRSKEEIFKSILAVAKDLKISAADLETHFVASFNSPSKTATAEQLNQFHVMLVKQFSNSKK